MCIRDRSSGDEPFAVGDSEGVVAACAPFDVGDLGGPDSEGCGGVGDGDVLGSSGVAQVVDGGYGDGPGEVFEDLAGDGSFEHPQDLFAAALLAVDGVAVAGHKGLGRWVP